MNPHQAGESTSSSKSIICKFERNLLGKTQPISDSWNLWSEMVGTNRSVQNECLVGQPG